MKRKSRSVSAVREKVPSLQALSGTAGRKPPLNCRLKW